MGATYGLVEDGTARRHPKSVNACPCGLMKTKQAKRCFTCEKEVRFIRPAMRRIAVRESVEVARKTRDAIAECRWLMNIWAMGDYR